MITEDDQVDRDSEASDYQEHLLTDRENAKKKKEKQMSSIAGTKPTHSRAWQTDIAIHQNLVGFGDQNENIPQSSE